jgi:hypothetical protein
MRIATGAVVVDVLVNGMGGTESLAVFEQLEFRLARSLERIGRVRKDQRLGRGYLSNE